MNNAVAINNKGISLAVKIPWLTLFLLVIIFFIAEHDFNFSIKQGLAISPADLYISAIIEGSLKRRIVFFILGFFGVFEIIRKGRTRLRINGLFGWLILCYLGWAFLSIAWTDDAKMTLRKLVVLTMLCLGAIAVRRQFSLKNIVSWIFFSSAIYLFIGILSEIIHGAFSPFSYGYRFAGTQHPNSQGINCALLLLSGLAMAKNTDKMRRLFFICSIIGFFFLFLTRSRTAFVSTLITLFFYWALITKTPKKVLLISILCFVALFLFIFIGGKAFQTSKDIVLLYRDDSNVSSLTGRIPLWEECASFIAKRPIIGYGYGGFWTANNLLAISPARRWGAGEGHSAYLDLILGLGIVGLIIYIAILILGIRISYIRYKTSLFSIYAFLCALLLFCALDGLLESATVNHSMLSFLSMVTIARLGFNKYYRKNRLIKNENN